jgi:hypothetical protein
LRRSLRETQSALASAGMAPSGAFAAGETRLRLLSEIRRAQRYGRNLAVLSVGVQRADQPQQVPVVEQQRTVYDAMKGLVRAHVDWIGMIDTPSGIAFAVVLPEAGIAEAPIVKERIANALRRFASVQLHVSCGVAALDRQGGGQPVEPEDLLAVVEQCRGCTGRAGPAQLATVQRSVAAHTAIVCRRGYAVDSVCTLKGDAVTDVPLAAAG